MHNDPEGGEIVQSFFWLILGVALFLFGLHTLSAGLRRSAGGRMRDVLARWTGTPVKGLCVGVAVTAVIQSSSATNVMVVSLVHAGLLRLEQAISVMLGANIGTTLTSQLLAVDISLLAQLFVFAGALLYLWPEAWAGAFGSFLRSAFRKEALGQAFFGIGSLFIGMDLMHVALAPLGDHPDIPRMMALLALRPYVAAAAGALFTAVVQSSSMMTGIAMVMAGTGMITLHGALGLVLGANIGTVITTLLAGIGTTVTARRAAVADLVFNVAGVVLFLPVLPAFAEFVSSTSTRVEQQVANAHGLFNVVTAVAALPFVTQLARLVRLWVKNGAKQD